MVFKTLGPLQIVFRNLVIHKKGVHIQPLFITSETPAKTLPKRHSKLWKYILGIIDHFSLVNVFDTQRMIAISTRSVTHTK